MILTTNNITIENSFNSKSGFIKFSYGSGFELIKDVIILPNSEILVTGSTEQRITSTNANGYIAKFLNDGSLDLKFGNKGGILFDDVYSSQLWVSSAGKISIAGFRNGSGFKIISFNQDGTLNKEFGVSGEIINSKISAQHFAFGKDGRVIISAWDGGDQILLCYTASGKLDESFGTNGIVKGISEPINEIKIKDTGEIVYIYSVNNLSGSNGFGISELNSNGQPNLSFGKNSKIIIPVGTIKYGNDPLDIEFQLDNKILIGGLSFNSNYQLVFTLLRINSDGTLDINFGTNGVVKTNQSSNNPGDSSDILVSKSGEIFLVGSSPINSNSIIVYKFLSNGTLDKSFDQDGWAVFQFDGARLDPFKLVEQADGKIVLSASLISGYYADPYIFRINLNGKLDLGSPVITSEKHDLSVIVDRGILGVGAVILKGLTETLTFSDGVITSQLVEYAGITFDYAQIDSLITTVTRDGNFTAEFTKEINDYLKTEANIAYKVAVGLVGIANIDAILMTVAGSDGNYVA
jgi:uncharacterized delta-60 repeat protein